ncbi:hypothetical protein ACFLU9_00955 [Chloroflexota bacterium]
MTEMFLHLVQYDTDPKKEDAFNLWYYKHVYNVLKVPGYAWCCRLVSLGGQTLGTDIRHLTLYRVNDIKAFDSVIGKDISTLPSPFREDMEEYAQITEATYVRSGVYQQIGGSHLNKQLLTNNHPLMLVMADVPAEHEDEWNRWNDKHVANIVNDRWIVAAGRFRTIDGIVPPYLVQAPRYLTIYELSGEEAATAMYDPKQMSPELRAEHESKERQRFVGMMKNRFRYFYRHISRHWVI